MKNLINLPRAVELLAPARDLATGIEAVKHGADAVYIGAPSFSARAAAGVSVEDIAALVEFAHLYGVKIFVALNTILYDDELEVAQHLINKMYAIGVDALIIQDKAILELDVPPMELHASTQCDNRTVDDVARLIEEGFEQVVLARELSLQEIRAICKAHADAVRLEVFVHGALCVSYSGCCYLSQAFSKRSANRGNCAQHCRLPYTLVDAGGKVLADKQYLLSLKDMNRLSEVADLLRAGASSLKIEGRLKSVTYVKNVVSAYRQALDKLIKANPDLYRRSSFGVETHRFTPNLNKSFNRGFTTYFLQGNASRNLRDMAAFDSPKHRGEFIGLVKNCTPKGEITPEDAHTLSTGDGLFFVLPDGTTKGGAVNKLSGSRFAVEGIGSLPKNTRVFRNLDLQFEKQLATETAIRKLPVEMRLTQHRWGLSLSIKGTPESKYPEVAVSRDFDLEQAKQFRPEKLKAELGALGTTPFVLSPDGLILDLFEAKPFIPISVIAEMRRSVAALAKDVWQFYKPKHRFKRKSKAANTSVTPRYTDYRLNVANRLARVHYEKSGIKVSEKAYELSPQKNAALMETKYCLLRERGECKKFVSQHHIQHREPLYLLHGNNRIRLQFDCANCRMLLFSSESN